MAPTAFIRNALLGAFVLLAIAGSIDYAVDPFQQYRVPTFYTPRFYHAYQRHENPGIARHYVYNRAVVGSSFFEKGDGSQIVRFCFCKSEQTLREAGDRLSRFSRT